MFLLLTYYLHQLLLCQMCDIKSMNCWVMPQSAHLFIMQLGLPDKCNAIKGMVVCNYWNLEPLDLLNGLALVVNNRPLRHESYRGIMRKNIKRTNTLHFLVVNPNLP